MKNTFGLDIQEQEFTVDLNNPSELKKLISKLQHRRKTLLRQIGADYIHFNGSRYNVRNILPVFDAILHTNITCLYEESDPKPVYYVYAHCDPSLPLNIQDDIKHIILGQLGLTHEPFYIGKGCGNRYLLTERNDSYRKIKSKITSRGKDIIIKKIREDMSEAEALSLEAKLIDILGLRSLSKVGMLVNLDEGLEPHRRRELYPTINGYTRKVLLRNGFNQTKKIGLT